MLIFTLANNGFHFIDMDLISLKYICSQLYPGSRLFYFKESVKMDWSSPLKLEAYPDPLRLENLLEQFLVEDIINL